MGEVHLSALAVVGGSAAKIAADGYADDDGGLETVVGAPADVGQLIAQLHEGGPNVVEELDFDDGLEASGGHADGAADDVGLGEWGVEDAVFTKLSLEACGDLKDAAFAFDVGEVLFTGDVGDVFTEDDDGGVAAHLFFDAGVDAVDHGLLGVVFVDGGVVKGVAGGVHVGGVNSCEDVGWVGRGGSAGCVFGVEALLLDFGAEGVESLLGEDFLFDEEVGEGVDGIALLLFLTLVLGFVELFVIGHGVAVGPDDVGVEHGRAFAAADVSDGLFGGAVAGDGVTTVVLDDVEVGEAGDEA